MIFFIYFMIYSSKKLIYKELHKMKENLPVVIIGGGPVGIAAAAHLIKRMEEHQHFISHWL